MLITTLLVIFAFISTIFVFDACPCRAPSSPFASINRGEPWHRLRQDNLSQVDLPADTSPELRGLLVALLRSNPAARITSGEVRMHPVVVRTRAAMDRLMEEAQRAGESPFAASPLAGVPGDFLAKVLGHDPGDVMDVGA